MIDKSLFKSISYLSLSNGIHALTYIALYVLLSRYLSVAEYGEYRQAFLFYEIMAPLLSLGLPAALFFILANQQDKKELILKKFNFLIVVFISLVFLLVGVIIYAFGFAVIAPAAIMKEYFWILYFFCISSALISLNNNYLIFSKKEKTTAIITIISMLCLLIIAVVVLFNTFSGKAVAIVRSVIYVIYILILLLVIRKRPFHIISFKESISYLSYSMPIFLAGYIGILSQHLDKTIVSNFFTVKEYGIYINGAFEIPLISVITGAITSAFITNFSVLCSEKKFTEALVSFKQITALTSLLIFPLFVFFFFSKELFIVLLFGEKYLESAIPFGIYLYILPIRIIFYGPALIAMGKAKLFMMRSIGELILNIILSIILYKLVGMYGVAIATVLSIYLWSVPFNLYHLKLGFDVRFREILPLTFILKCILIAVTSSVVIFIGKYFLSTMPIVIIFGGTSLLYFSTVFLFYFKLKMFKR